MASIWSDVNIVLEAFNHGYEKLLMQEYRPRIPVQEKERLIAGMSLEQIEQAKKIVMDILNQEMKAAMNSRN